MFNDCNIFIFYSILFNDVVQISFTLLFMSFHVFVLN